MTTEHDLLQIRADVRRPDDFRAFWDATLAKLGETELEWDRAESATLAADGRTVYTLRMGSFGDTLIYGWLAVPDDTTALLPGYLWLPGYSLGNPPPGPESLYGNVVTLGLNVHGNPPDTPYLHPFTQSKDYVVQGIESPETYIFRAIVAHCVRAFEVLMRQPEVDPDRCVVGGMSQGGGLALIVAALLARSVRLCFADMPWLCNLDLALSLIDRERYRRSPHMRVPDGRYYIEQYAESHPELRERIFRAYRYFDPLSHAPDIAAPVQMSAGGRDPSCRPPTIYSVYNAIAAPKEMLYLPNTGHEIVGPMWEAHSNWLRSKLQ